MTAASRLGSPWTSIVAPAMLLMMCSITIWATSTASSSTTAATTTTTTIQSVSGPHGLNISFPIVTSDSPSPSTQDSCTDGKYDDVSGICLRVAPLDIGLDPFGVDCDLNFTTAGNDSQQGNCTNGLPTMCPDNNTAPGCFVGTYDCGHGSLGTDLRCQCDAGWAISPATDQCTLYVGGNEGTGSGTTGNNGGANSRIAGDFERIVDKVVRAQSDSNTSTDGSAGSGSGEPISRSFTGTTNLSKVGVRLKGAKQPRWTAQDTALSAIAFLFVGGWFFLMDRIESACDIAK
jgi:hypothetical protein